MAGRWRDPAAFRADPTAVPALHPSRRQSIALLVVILLAAGAAAAASWLVRPERARSFSLVHGSLFLADSVAPVAIDLPSGRPTVRLIDAGRQVGARQADDLAVVPVDDGTLLLNRETGEFNMVDNTGFVIKNTGGVSLAQRAGSTAAVGLASTDGFAYIEQTGANGTSVYLVGPTTVRTATDANAQVKPRAFRSMPEPGSTDPGAAASAGGELWLLVGSGPRRTIRQLALPADSSAGATLTSTDKGTVNGVAAINTATDGAGAAVGVAAADRISVYSGNSDAHTVRFPAIAGADSILPASNGAGRLSYLVHGSRGWSVVSVATDGSGLRGPRLLTGVTPGAKFVAPAASGTDLYTMDTAGGQLVRIDGKDHAGPVAGAGSYPLTKQNGRVIEASGFADAYLIARESRVIVNSPDHLEALVLFTDGSRPPLTIEKSDAVAVSASEGAEALTRSRINPGTEPKPGDSAKPRAAAINNKIDCKTTNQKPHIPTIDTPVPGSRSAQLAWTYPLVDPQDCEPTTYVVKVKLISNAAPSPPSSVTVQGQRQVNLTGLFPSTRYEITVTAYLNGKGTESDPAQITTGPEGPAPPQDVRALADADGNWNLTWNSCGSVKEGCVPSASWKVIPEFCDGRGLSQAPNPISVTADPTAVQQPPAQLKGNDALLGRGVRFQVEGLGEQGTVGEPSGSTACVYSWSRPDAATMKLNATQPPHTTLGGSVATTVSLDLGTNPVRDVGGIGAQITLRLTGPGYSQSKVITYNGRSSNPKASFDGVKAGLAYTATAVVSPPQHSDSSVTLGPQTVSTSAAWPSGLGVTAACPPALLTCDLRVEVTGLTSEQAHGERFDLDEDASRIQCGNVGKGLKQNDFDPSKATITDTLSQLSGYFGTCTVTIVLVESGSNPAPLVFGGVPSQTLTAPVALGKPATVDLDESDFVFNWDPQGGASAEIKYKGGKGDLDLLTQGWTETVAAPNGTACGTGHAVPGRLDATAAYVQVDPDCVNRYGGSTNDWVITLTYHNATNNSVGPTVDLGLAGPPPGYQPCDPGFQAVWGDTRDAGVTVSVSGGDIGGCSDWHYTLESPDGQTCTASTDAPTDPPTVVIPINCGVAASLNDWTVVITWHDTAGDPQGNNPNTPVTGTPPEE